MAEEKNITVVVRNVTNGPKVLNSIPAGVLAAGDSTDEPVEMTVGEYASAKKTGWFEFEGASDDGSKADFPALTGKNKAELLEIAKAENVTIEDNATNADIVSAIELAREEAAKA